MNTIGGKGKGNGTCLNCGEYGHIRAQCQTPFRGWQAATHGKGKGKGDKGKGKGKGKDNRTC